jgi:hypothetical protein
MTRTVSSLTTALLVLAAAFAALSAPGTAAAKGTKCGNAIIADWFDDGRIDKIYPLHCYEEAIDAVPPDIRDYADAADVIQRALQQAMLGRLDPCKGCRNPAKGRSTETGDQTNGSSTQAVGAVDTSGPSSVPIPLLVLGGIALALLAAGGLGYYQRRHQAATGEDESDDDESSS